MRVRLKSELGTTLWTHQDRIDNEVLQWDFICILINKVCLRIRTVKTATLVRLTDQVAMTHTFNQCTPIIQIHSKKFINQHPFCSQTKSFISLCHMGGAGQMVRVHTGTQSSSGLRMESNAAYETELQGTGSAEESTAANPDSMPLIPGPHGGSRELACELSSDLPRCAMACVPQHMYT